ncbi:hypothetical protein BpHYR1_018248 [Brachionus plicatilis]|uniref:Uncharacterized protein n=1 Tax=Brachionus plicatilis TaxID=10195 RepID=A0A3M7PLN2_BRAPC|nr:hypothetical protein BpHYR1_018248 [Brachionus plicatilis]
MTDVTCQIIERFRKQRRKIAKSSAKRREYWLFVLFHLGMSFMKMLKRRGLVTDLDDDKRLYLNK